MGLFFKTPRIRGFEHKPIYWNPEKERREERLERVKQELGMTEEEGAYKPLIRRGTFREQRTTIPHQRRQSTIFRVLLIALAIIALVYYFL
jgi:hypothetical protein